MLDNNGIFQESNCVCAGGKWQIGMLESFFRHGIAVYAKALCHLSNDGWLQGIAPVCRFTSFGSCVLAKNRLDAEHQHIVGAGVGTDTKQAGQL